MSKRAAIVCAAIVAVFVPGNPAPAQNSDASATPIRIQLIVSGQGTDGLVAARTNTVSVATDPDGRFNVNIKPPDDVLTVGCNGASGDSATRSAQAVGIKIEGSVTPASEGRFQINLTITNRSWPVAELLETSICRSFRIALSPSPYSSEMVKRSVSTKNGVGSP